MCKYLVTLLFFMVAPLAALAEPAPFGLEIKKTTYEEARQKYPGLDNGINHYSLGRMYDIDCSSIEMEGLLSMRLIFGQDDKLLAILMAFKKNRYDSLLQSLASKYRLLSKKDAFVGDKGARFQDQNTHIELDAPHMNFKAELNYIHSDLKKAFLEKSSQERQAKKEKEKQSL